MKKKVDLQLLIFSYHGKKTKNKTLMVKYQQYICSFSKDISTQLKKQQVGIKLKLLYLC